jgi:hypothetical protein
MRSITETDMPRTATISRPHPSPRFCDKIRLRQGRRGPDDKLWCATFCVDGTWQTTRPVSLGTTDFDEACEVARDKFAAMNGHGVRAVLRPYNTAESAKPAVTHPLKLYADRAAAKLRDEADAADAETPGKGHNFRDIARRINDDLTPKWGDTDITKLDEHTLNDWIADEYRVEDVAARVARYGRQPRGKTRQKVLKMPGVTTLGNLDWALRHIWLEAVADKIVDRRKRPMIDKELGEEGEPRAFIDAAGVQAVARVMTDEWIATANHHGPDIKRMLRTYVAMIACTGMRTGLEAKRVRIGNVRFVVQEGRRVILINVAKHQGKHTDDRVVIVYEGDDQPFAIRWLLHQHIAWRRSQGAEDRDYLFAWPDGRFPVFRDGLDDVLRQANALTDPMTGEKRVAYSFRHYFATKLITRSLSVAQIAEWLGTSSAMIERHYHKHLMERNAHLLNGASLHLMIDPNPDPWRTPEDDRLDELVDR